MLYTSPVADIIKSHDLQYHFYADDTQLYITFNTDSADDACLAKSRVEHCVEEIDRWMISNKLKLNVDKTELIVFSSKYCPKPCLSNSGADLGGGGGGGAEGAAAPPFSSSEIYFLSKYTIIL